MSATDPKRTCVGARRKKSSLLARLRHWPTRQKCSSATAIVGNKVDSANRHAPRKCCKMLLRDVGGAIGRSSQAKNRPPFEGLIPNSCVPLPGRFFTAFGRTRGVSGQMHQSAFLRHCRLLSVAALGAMLAFPASAQTGSESQTPSTGSPGSESQTPSTGSPGSEPQTPSTATLGTRPKLQAPPHRAPRPVQYRVRLLAPIRRSRRLIRRPRPSSHARQRFPIFLSQLTSQRSA